MEKEEGLNYIKKVIQRGDINCKDEYGYSIAHVAMKIGDEELALSILKNPEFDLSIKYVLNKKKYNLLYLAAEYACEEVVDYLLGCKEFLPYINEGESPLYGAIPEILVFCDFPPPYSDLEYEKMKRIFTKILDSTDCTNMQSFYSDMGEADIFMKLLGFMEAEPRLESWAELLLRSPKMKNINAVTGKNTLLTYAIRVKSERLVSMILDREDFSKINEFSDNHHALCQAFSKGQYSILRRLFFDPRIDLSVLPELLFYMTLHGKTEKDSILAECLKSISFPITDKGSYDKIFPLRNTEYPKTLQVLLEEDKVLMSEERFAKSLFYYMKCGMSEEDQKDLWYLKEKRRRQIENNQYDESLEDTLLTHYFIHEDGFQEGEVANCSELYFSSDPHYILIQSPVVYPDNYHIYVKRDYLENRKEEVAKQKKRFLSPLKVYK